MSDLLYDIRVTPELGRHLVARRAISPGQLVVQQEPFCAVLYDEQVPLRCDFCFRPAAPGEALRRCSRSRHARYCSREHQMEAWASGYKQECQALVAQAPRVPPPTVRLAARALWRHLRQQGGADRAEHCSWDAVQALLSHWESVEDDRKITYAQMAVLTREFAASGLAAAAADAERAADALPPVQEVAHLLARFACNNHTICDEELRPLGVGLYPLGALLNHSCQPNCMQSFGPRGRIEFRSLVDIQPGEPLTISYVELAATRQERREELAAYYFDIERPSLPPPPPPAHAAAAAAAGPSGTGSQQQGAAAAAAAASSPATGASASPTPAAALPPPYSRSCLRPSAPVAEVSFHLEDRPDSPSAAASELAEGSELPCLLRVYPSAPGCRLAPPWPCDERDALLTQLVVPQQQPSSAPRSLGGAVPLPGGVQVHLVSKQAGPFDGSGEEEPMELDEGEEGNAAEEPGRRLPEAAAGRDDRQVVEVDCWGDWALRSLDAAAGKLAAASLSSIDEEGEEGQGSAGAAAAVLVGALARRLGAAAHLQARAEQLGAKGKHELAVQLLQRALGLVDPGEVPGAGATGAGSEVLPGLGQFHLLRMRLNAALLKAAVEEGNSWEVALQAARDLLPVYQLVYPPTWPNLGLHLATLAKLELLQDHPQRAHEHARRALPILEVTHSKSGGLGSGGQGVLNQVEDCVSQAAASVRALSSA